MAEIHIVLDKLRLSNPMLHLSERVTPALVTLRAFYQRPARSKNADEGGESALMSPCQRTLLNAFSSVPFVLTHSKQNTTGQGTKPAYICHLTNGLALLTDLDIHHMEVACRCVFIAILKAPRMIT